MAHFRTTTTNSRGNTVSACAGATKGQVTRINGWNGGIAVYSSVDKHGRDVFAVCVTGGSNAADAGRYVGQLLGDVWYPRTSV